MTGILVYTGNGAVGATTCAAASGVALAGEGTEAVVVTIDPKRSLSKAFETEVGPEPTRVHEGVTGVEIGPEAGQETYADLFDTLADSLSVVGIDLDDGHVEEFVDSERIPMGRQVAALEAIASFVQDPTYGSVVVDTGPDGRLLRLLRQPGLLGLGVGIAQDLTNQLERATRGTVDRIADPIPWVESGDDSGPPPEVDEEIENRIATVRSILSGAGRRQFRVVTTPEEAAVRYTDYLVENVTRAGVPMGPLIVNQVIEEYDEGCARCRSRRERQQATLSELREQTDDLELCTLPDYRGRAEGIGMLELLADQIPQ